MNPILKWSKGAKQVLGTNTCKEDGKLDDMSTILSTELLKKSLTNDKSRIKSLFLEHALKDEADAFENDPRSLL